MSPHSIATPAIPQADIASDMTEDQRHPTPGKMGGSHEVNKAPVVCGNVQTANATVYIIDTVLMPPSS